MKLLAVLLVFAASSASAQAAATRNPAPRPASSLVAGIRSLWEMDRGYLLDAAEQVPESSYSVRPAPGARSFGEVMAHVANAHRLFCGMALGDTTAGSNGAWTAKADIVAALQASNDYCAKAYAMSDSDATSPMSQGAQRTWGTIGLGEARSRFHTLTVNAWHDHEHYGNIATYMRIMGMIPPSSQPKK